MNNPSDPSDPHEAAALAGNHAQDIPFERTRQFQDMLAAAHEFLLNRVED